MFVCLGEDNCVSSTFLILVHACPPQIETPWINNSNKDENHVTHHVVDHILGFHFQIPYFSAFSDHGFAHSEPSIALSSWGKISFNIRWHRLTLWRVVQGPITPLTIIVQVTTPCTQWQRFTKRFRRFVFFHTLDDWRLWLSLGFLGQRLSGIWHLLAF